MLYTMKEAEDLVYHSYLQAKNQIHKTNDKDIKKSTLTRTLFDLIGSPDQGQKFILVTGSKGKGSTSRFISSLLSHTGLKVGLFTSPHLVHFNERIRVDGKAIPDEDYIRLSNRILPAINQVKAILQPKEYIGPIVITLAIAILYFRENNTDINVIECGRGGLYDDTNILNNEYAVITPIMEEHLNELGPTINHVIDHKLGIIKGGTKSVYFSEQEENRSKIQEKLQNSVKRISYYGEEFYATNIKMTTEGTSFSVQTKSHLIENIQMPLLGNFQAINAATAIQVCNDICGEHLNEEVIKACFHSIQWPGRCEVIDHNPTTIVDGSIHRDSANYMKQIVQWLKPKKVVTIIGVPKDKDYQGVIKVASQFSHQLLITKPDISHLEFPEDAIDYACSLKPHSVETNVLSDAVALAKKEYNPDMIVILGTQTLIANAKRLWNQSLLDIGK